MGRMCVYVSGTERTKKGEIEGRVHNMGFKGWLGARSRRRKKAFQVEGMAYGGTGTYMQLRSEGGRGQKQRLAF